MTNQWSGLASASENKRKDRSGLSLVLGQKRKRQLDPVIPAKRTRPVCLLLTKAKPVLSKSDPITPNSSKSDGQTIHSDSDFFLFKAKQRVRQERPTRAVLQQERNETHLHSTTTYLLLSKSYHYHNCAVSDFILTHRVHHLTIKTSQPTNS